ncbi:uncharacterized protein LOC144713909 [Wolffia australiana]
MAVVVGSHSQSTLLLQRSRLFPVGPRLPCRPSLRLGDFSPASASHGSIISSRASIVRFSRTDLTRQSAVPDSSGAETGGGGGQGGGGGGGGSGGGDSSDDWGHEKMGGGMTLSQKITLGYAALVGLGGVMGYLKSGSQKSLGAGGASALLLCFVYTQLPARPAFASAIGLGLSAALLAVMGSRFKKSGKIFPAGVVSLVSLVMVGGYAHGIMRGLH